MNKQGRRPELHMVDGREMTAREIADMLGISYSAMTARHSRLNGISYQAIVNMYRDNQWGSGRDRAARYRIEGRWMTRAQIAEMLGIVPQTLSTWRWQNRASMEEAVAHFRQWNEAGRKRNPPGNGGRPAQQYRVGSRYYTIPGVARKYSVSAASVREVLRYRGGDMARVLAYYQDKERRRRQRAEKEILRILGY